MRKDSSLFPFLGQGDRYLVHISMRKVLADYNRGTNQSITVPFRAACQSIKFLKDTKDGKFIEIKKEILHPQCARTTILRQPQSEIKTHL
jgi:hypothetical protein